METKKAKTTVLTGLLALAGLAVIFSPVYAGNLEPSAPPAPTMKTLDEVEPRIPIHASDLPLTITEPNSYYLVEDVNFTDDANHAITIGCNDVTINLMGYTLKGPNSIGYSGIYMDGRTNVEVRNGTVRTFGSNGVHADSIDYSRGHRVIDVRAISNGAHGIYLEGAGHFIHACTVMDNGNYGIATDDSSTVTGNTAYNNGGYGITASKGSTVAGNTAYGNGDGGIYTSYGSTVTGNTVHGNATEGINAPYGNMVTGNTARYNTANGIRVAIYCMVTDNACYYNGNGGNGAGILATGYGNRIERNHVSYNDRGIDVDDNPNLIVKNSATANTIAEYDIFAGNKVGPIVSDPNTTTNPWANFNF